MAQMNLSTERKQTRGHGEQTCGCRSSGGGSGMDWEAGVSTCKRLHLEWIRSEILLYSPRNCIQSLVMERDRAWEREKKTVSVCITGSLCCTAEINTTQVNYNKKFLRKEKELEKKDQRALKVNFTLAGCFCFPIRSMTQLSCSHLCEPHTVERGALR